MYHLLLNLFYFCIYISALFSETCAVKDCQALSTHYLTSLDLWSTFRNMMSNDVFCRILLHFVQTRKKVNKRIRMHICIWPSNRVNHKIRFEQFKQLTNSRDCQKKKYSAKVTLTFMPNGTCIVKDNGLYL